MQSLYNFYNVHSSDILWKSRQLISHLDSKRLFILILHVSTTACILKIAGCELVDQQFSEKAFPTITENQKDTNF